MGLFDSVYVDCPSCGAAVEFQSKACADAYCRRFTLADAPAQILTDIMNSPEYCETCGDWFALIDPAYPPGHVPRPSLKPAKVKTPDDPIKHEQGMRWWPTGRAFTFADLK